MAMYVFFVWGIGRWSEPKIHRRFAYKTRRQHGSMCVRVMNENVGCCRTMELCMAKYDHNDIPMYLSNSPFEENWWEGIAMEAKATLR